MRLKIILLLFLIVTGLFCKANMGSPVTDGTKAATAYTSKDIDILSETIHITIDKAFTRARYVVEYTLQSDKVGKQIPLLFFAQDYEDGFMVWLDGQPVPIQHIPAAYTQLKYSPFAAFDTITKYIDPTTQKDHVAVYWYKNTGYSYPLNDLKYFEAAIDKGVHKVRVAYTAKVWKDVGNWINEYSFRYSLTPAEFWRSFGLYIL